MLKWSRIAINSSFLAETTAPSYEKDKMTRLSLVQWYRKKNGVIICNCREELLPLPSRRYHWLYRRLNELGWHTSQDEPSQEEAAQMQWLCFSPQLHISCSFLPIFSVTLNTHSLLLYVLSHLLLTISFHMWEKLWVWKEVCRWEQNGLGCFKQTQTLLTVVLLWYDPVYMCMWIYLYACIYATNEASYKKEVSRGKQCLSMNTCTIT